ncbi:MAG: FAD-dependent oxidoreductase [Chitinophagaceae bacterium]|nr:FAD-dependent oxidoreductase [Chitinophagaceae bacterium]
MALLPWRKALVTHTEDATHNTRIFFLEIQDTGQFDFKPGQFITLDLPIDEKPARRLRSYSIASRPDGSNLIELLIVRTPEGKGTRYLFEEVKAGSEITFRGPQGVFVLPEKLDKEIFMICTGTGVAPFRSMIQHIYHHHISFHKIHLVFGTRTRADLLYYDEFRELEKKLPGFGYYPTLSREQWAEGYHGYVHGVYEKLCEHRPDARFYLCGWKNMIDDARKKILEMGYDKKAIHLELYG